MKRQAAGFTLVEVLVVLVIGSLVSALLFQMLAQTYRLRSRFADQLAESQTGRMRADWLRQALRGLESLTQDAPSRFAGQPQRMQGLTSAPIDLRGSAKRDYKLEWTQLGSGWALQYADGGVPWTLWSAGTAGLPGFRYLDAQGGEHRQWPPPGAPPVAPATDAAAALGLNRPAATWPQLPSAVVLSWHDAAGREQVLVAAIAADPDVKRPRLNLLAPPP